MAQTKPQTTTTGTDIMPVLNWCYGAKSPDLTEAVDEQLSLAHKYRNKWCELELQKRDRYYEILKALVPEYLACEQAIEKVADRIGELREAIQRARSIQQTKAPSGMDDVRAEIKEQTANIRELRAQSKALKKAAFDKPDVAAAIKANQDRHKAECRQARKQSGLYWGTYGLIETSCRSFSSHAPPRFTRWTGEGQLGVQLQKGLPVDDAMTADTRCYIHGKGKRRTVMFRIGSDGRFPIFAQIPIVFHRPLPEGGRIKWCYLERRKLAYRDVWQIRFTIEVPAAERQINDQKWCALHVGWKAVPSGLQVAVWQKHDGRTGRVVLPNHHLIDHERLDHIRRWRDLWLQDAIELIRSHRKTAPEWFQDLTKQISRWKTPARVVHLLRIMQENNWDTESVIRWPNTPVELSRRIPPRRAGLAAVTSALKQAGFAVFQQGENPDYLKITRGGTEFFVRCSNHVGYMPDQTKYTTLSDFSHVQTFCKALSGGTWTLGETLRGMVTTDKLLWHHQARMGKRLIGRRNNTYRNLAAQLSSDCDVLFMGKPDVKRLTLNSRPEELLPDQKTAHRQSRQAATASLLQMAAEKFPCRAIEVDIKNLTKECSLCGTVNEVDGQTVICTACKAEIDRETNALHNTIARGQVLLDSGALLEMEAAEQKRKETMAARQLKMRQGRRAATGKKDVSKTNQKP